MLQFDSTVTLGNIITVGAVLLSIVRTWSVLDSKLKGIEEWIKGHEECSQQQREILDEVRSGLAFLRGMASQRRFADKHKDRDGGED